MRPPHDASLRALARERLSAFSRLSSEPSGHVRAAVALLLTANERGETCFLLTRRTRSLARHGGQFALPGGRLELGETPEQAAARELEEEVGVAASEVEPLGLLDDFVTRSGFVITPVVLWAEPLVRLAPDPNEVAIVYPIPIPSLYLEGSPRVTPGEEPGRPLISFALLGTFIHSPTAAIVYQMRAVVFDGEPLRVAHFDQPRFAWR